MGVGDSFRCRKHESQSLKGFKPRGGDRRSWNLGGDGSPMARIVDMWNTWIFGDDGSPMARIIDMWNMWILKDW